MPSDVQQRPTGPIDAPAPDVIRSSEEPLRKAPAASLERLLWRPRSWSSLDPSLRRLTVERSTGYTPETRESST